MFPPYASATYDIPVKSTVLKVSGYPGYQLNPPFKNMFLCVDVVEMADGIASGKVAEVNRRYPIGIEKTASPSFVKVTDPLNSTLPC